MFPSERKESFFGINHNFWVILTSGIIHLALYSAIEPFTTLYLRDIGISYFGISLLAACYSLVIIPSVLIGSYFSDFLPHRRSRFAAANCCCWGVMCVVYSIINNFLSALVVFIIAGLSYIFYASSRAYMLDQSPQDSRYTAMGFFSLYRGPMVVFFCILLGLFKKYDFISGMRLGLFISGSVILVMGIFRALFLVDPQKSKYETKGNPSLAGLIKDTVSTLRHLTVLAPLFVVITLLDAFSDSLWSFLIYFILNEQAGLSASEILQGRLLIDLLSIPIILYLAFRINQANGRKTFFTLYSIVPIAVCLLIMSLSYPTIPWIPNSVALKKLAFFAYSIKYIQDFLWAFVLLAPVAMKVCPKEHATKAIGLSWLLIHLSQLVAVPIAGFVYENCINGATILLYSILGLNLLIILAILTLDLKENSLHDERDKVRNGHKKFSSYTSSLK